MRKNRVDVITMGCSKNLVDSEMLMRQFADSGYQVQHDPERVQGEIVVVNTCGFIESAREESINMILQLVQAKESGDIGKLYVMGCLSERYMEELKAEIPEVDGYYGKFNWRGLVQELGKAYHTSPAEARLLTTPSHYAYVKLSEGCSRTCAYCSIPLMTGQHISRPREEIVAEVKELASRGVKELQLIAQDLTYYGRELYHRPMLPQLVEELCQVEGIEWIRLHYAYPNAFPYDLLRVMREQPKVCNYLDIALQHISDKVLHTMRRHVTKEETLALIERIRHEVPGIHLRTTLMIGHPGEGEAEFQELLRFVQWARFERMGAFAYSHEEGTYGYQHYQDEVPLKEKMARLDQLLTLQEQIALEITEEKVGQRLPIILDREEGDYYIGRTEYDSPDVDGEVLLPKPATSSLAMGHFYLVKVVGTEGHDLIAELCHE